MSAYEGKVVIVTGGAKGIGRGIVEGFAAEGAAVTIADVDPSAARDLARSLSGGGRKALAVVADVSLRSNAERIVAETVSAFGAIDVLVNNAGIQPSRSYANVVDTLEEDWDRIINVNLKSQYLMSKYAIPEMRKRGGGAIINIASVQGLQSMPRVPAYAASKGGSLSLTRNMALDFARENIRVVAICPGTIDSEMVRTAARAEGGDLDATLRRYGSTHPLGRIGLPADIANACLFLASDKASFITGDYLCVDGGYMAQGAWVGSAGAD